MGIVSAKLRASAKGQPCCFHIPGVCAHDPERTVLCHIRDENKGVGNKADDWSGAFGCDKCHEAIDQHHLSREDEEFYMRRALQRTWAIWISLGLVIIPVDPETAKRRPKKPGNWQKGRKLQSRNTLSKVSLAGRGELMRRIGGEDLD